MHAVFMHFFTATSIAIATLVWVGVDNPQVRQPANTQEVAMAQVDTAPDINPDRGRRRR